MIEPDYTSMTDLASPRLGSRVLFATDDFFAEKSRLISPAEPVFIDGKYDDHGKWMDGWETRRRRSPGHDYAIIKLGRRGHIRGFDVDTRHFTGNFPPFASLELANSKAEIPNDDDWVEVVEKSSLTGNAHHYFEIDKPGIWTHVRLHIYPDGGVARLRVYGHVFTDWDNIDHSQILDLSALAWGGRVLGCSNAHYGSGGNLIAPGPVLNMGDGWETRRYPQRGVDERYWTDICDFVVIALAHRGEVEKIVIDTAFFKGNYPDRASIQAIDFTPDADQFALERSEDWPILLPAQKLEMDREHVFTKGFEGFGPVSHIRLNIYPDGGLSRIHVLGKITRP